MTERRPAEVFHPGEYLLDELNARNWSQAEFAEIINRPYRLVNEIVNGKRGISPETARELGAAFGTSAKVWMNLDTAYNLWKSTADVSQIERRAKLSSEYPVRDMLKRNWLIFSDDISVTESRLLRYFEISSISEQPKYALLAVPRRSNSNEEKLTPIQVAWLYRVKHIADAMRTPKYSEKKLRNALQQMKAYRQAPEEIRHIPELLETCGVRFVIVEHLPSSKIDGVCLWLDNNTPVIGLTLRFGRIDNFWFVLRHEIEHVLRGDGRGAVILDYNIEEDLDDENLSRQEQAANAAAAEFCVPQDELDNFIARKGQFIAERDLINFARSLGVHPGLVAGQLQQRTKRYDRFRKMLVSIKGIITPVSITDGYRYSIPVEI